MPTPIDIVTVKNAGIAKGGYSITPSTRMIQDLVDLLNNLNTTRSTSPNQCSGHVVSALTGKSIGDVNYAINNVRPLKCSCQSYTAGCSCENVSQCSCKNVQSCACKSNTGSPCSCDGEGTSCPCYSKGYCSCDGEMGCACQGDSEPKCTCEGQTSGCGCQGYSSGCGCQSDVTCSCNNVGCGCNNKTSSCPCNNLFAF